MFQTGSHSFPSTSVSGESQWSENQEQDKYYRNRGPDYYYQNWESDKYYHNRGPDYDYTSIMPATRYLCAFPNCKRQFLTKQYNIIIKHAIIRHYLEHLPLESAPYVCTACDRGLFDEKHISLHTESTSHVKTVKKFDRQGLAWEVKNNHLVIGEAEVETWFTTNESFSGLEHVQDPTSSQSSNSQPQDSSSLESSVQPADSSQIKTLTTSAKSPGSSQAASALPAGQPTPVSDQQQDPQQCQSFDSQPPGSHLISSAEPQDSNQEPSACPAHATEATSLTPTAQPQDGSMTASIQPQALATLSRYKCRFTDCSRIFHSIKEVTRHYLQHLPMDQAPHNCTACYKGLLDSQHVKQHCDT